VGWVIQGGGAVWAGDSVEPAYCEPSQFFKTEMDSFKENPKLIRARGFRLGEITLVGLSVGRSEVAEVMSIAKRSDRSQDISTKNYCTWYLHYPTPNPFYFLNSLYAMPKFNFAPILRNPKDLSPPQAVKEVMGALGDSFSNETPSFLSCLAENKYLALGCQGMMHRGPTAFGAVLSFLGCTPQHSAEIVNALWGLNTVDPQVRLSVLQAAYDYGKALSESQRQSSRGVSTEDLSQRVR